MQSPDRIYCNNITYAFQMMAILAAEGHKLGLLYLEIGKNENKKA